MNPNILDSNAETIIKKGKEKKKKKKLSKLKKIIMQEKSAEKVSYSSYYLLFVARRVKYSTKYFTR